MVSQDDKIGEISVREEESKLRTSSNQSNCETLECFFSSYEVEVFSLPVFDMRSPACHLLLESLLRPQPVIETQSVTHICHGRVYVSSSHAQRERS